MSTDLEDYLGMISGAGLVIILTWSLYPYIHLLPLIGAALAIGGYFFAGAEISRKETQNMNIEKNPDPVYGEGFRRVRAIAERMGFQKFVEMLRTTKRMPM